MKIRIKRGGNNKESRVQNQVPHIIIPGSIIAIILITDIANRGRICLANILILQQQANI